MTIADRRDIVRDGLLSVPEAATFLSVCSRYVYELLADKRLIGVRMGKRWAVPKKALIEYAAERINIS